MGCPPGQNNSGHCREVAVSGEVAISRGSTVDHTDTSGRQK